MQHLRPLFVLSFVAVLNCFAQGSNNIEPADPPAPGATNASEAKPNAARPPLPAAGDPLFAPLAKPFTRQNLHEKFMDYAVANYGPRAIFAPVIPAAIRMINPPDRYPGEWRQGLAGFGRNYGDVIAATTSGNTGRFLAGALLHEDFRYRPATGKGAIRRSLHAFTYAFVDQSDSGAKRIAFANFIGAGAGGFVGRGYLPDGFDDLSHAQTRTAIVFGSYAARNLAREFAPELLKLSRKLHIPFPQLPFPEWWVPR